MPPNKDGIIAFGRSGENSDYFGESDEVIDEHKRNITRYKSLKTNYKDPRQVLCYDFTSAKSVWGTFKPFGVKGRLYIFVPN